VEAKSPPGPSVDGCSRRGLFFAIWKDRQDASGHERGMGIPFVPVLVLRRRPRLGQLSRPRTEDEGRGEGR